MKRCRWRALTSVWANIKPHTCHQGNAFYCVLLSCGKWLTPCRIMGCSHSCLRPIVHMAQVSECSSLFISRISYTLPLLPMHSILTLYSIWLFFFIAVALHQWPFPLFSAFSIPHTRLLLLWAFSFLRLQQPLEPINFHLLFHLKIITLRC